MIRKRELRALRVVSSHRRGSSRPLVIETEAGLFVTKLRGAGQGTGPLVAEVIVAELADALGLRVPRRALIHLDEALSCADRDPEVLALLEASQGVNLGFRFLDDAALIRPHEIAAAREDLACPVLWLDAFVMNSDRTPRNPNILISGRRPWLIDHGASLPFQYNWRAVREQSPRRRSWPIERHLFAAWAPGLERWDDRLAARLNREVLREAVARVPETFLRPLLAGDASAETVLRRRRAYEAFLWKRLKAPRPFVGAYAQDSSAVGP